MNDVHACIHMQDSHLTINNAVEIVGKVQPDLSIKVFQATDFGDNIGMLNYLLEHLPQIICWSVRRLLIDPPHQIFPFLSFAFYFFALTPSSCLDAPKILCKFSFCLTITLDFTAVTALVEATHRYKEIFYEAPE